MPDIINGLSGAIAISTTTPMVITSNGVINATDPIAALFIGAVAGELFLAGLITSETSVGINTNGDDRIIISQTGQIYMPGAGGNGIFLGSDNNDLIVGGTIYASDFGILGLGEGDTVTITETGSVTGGANRGASGSYSAAIGFDDAGATATLTNHGLITAEVNEDTGLRVAVMQAASNFSDPTGLDTSTDAVLIFSNYGTVVGDVYAAAGNDVIENAGLIDGTVFLGIGNDVFDGRDGSVTGGVFGEDDDDVMIGSNSGDLFFGGNDDDLLFGLDGSDVLFSGQGEDTILGGAGDDNISGGSNSDTILGGSGDDDIDGGSGADEILGDSGDDTIDGGSADDTIDGGSGDDDIRGGNQDDEISGGSGNDLLRGENDNDTIGGGAGEDTIAGGTGNDSIDAGSGDDRVFGGSGNDTIEGTLGDDFVDGGSGDDSLSGGSDNDTLIGGSGQDTMSGGWGADVFDFNAISDSATGSATRDTITDFETGVDLIDLSGISSSLTFVNAFTGTAGEVRYNESIGRLYIDIDGDSASDFQIDLGAGTVLTEDDLVF